MKKIYLKKFLLIFSGLSLFTYTIVSACGGWGWGFNDTSNYTPEAFAVDKSYTPLFLSYDFFYDIGYDAAHSTRFNNDIVKDWSSYLGTNIDKEVVEFFLLDEKSLEAVNNLYDFFTTGTNNLEVKRWNEKVDLSNTKFKSFIEFLYLAKQVEVVSVVKDYWSYEPIEYKTLEDLTILKTIEEKYNKTEDSFLKNRYWFQTIKANFYSLNNSKNINESSHAVTFFEETKNKVPENLLYYRALSYVAGIYYKMADYSTANYLYSKVFDECPPLRVVAAYSFHPQEQTDWEKALTLAKTNKEKAALWAIQGYYGNEMNAMEQIFNLDPTNKHLDYLLTRLVNHQEEKIKEFSKGANFDSNKRTQYSLIDKDVLALVAKIANSNKTNNSFLWTTSLGYLQTLNGNYKDAKNSFNAAEKNVPKTKLAENQLQLLRFINELNGVTEINEDVEQRILPYLHWLYEELPKNPEEAFRFGNATRWSNMYLSSLYSKQKNPVMAEMFQPSMDWDDNYFYDDLTRLQAMEDFMLKKEHSEMETLALNRYPLDVNDIYYHKAVLATYNNNIPEAIAQYEKAGKEISLLANPFNGFIQDNHDFEHAKNKTYDGRKFLNTVNAMQQKLAQNEDIYSNSILLGNAFYNITHFGSGRSFYESSQMIGSYSSPVDFRHISMRLITDCSIAASYYKMAYENAETKEQKAESAYMLAKCERNAYYNKKYYYRDIRSSYWSDDKIDFIAWAGFKKLKEEYSDTEYYKEVIKECGYFKTYVDKN